MADPEEFQKEEISIPDTPDLVRQLLIDDLRNHLLKHVVPHEKIITAYQATWGELPGIYIKEVEYIPMLQEEAIPGGVGSTWTSIIEIHLISSDDSYTNYPLPNAGELDADETRFNGAEKVLNVIKNLVYRTIAENRENYASDTIPTFVWDDNKLLSSTLLDGGYDGDLDNWAIIMAYQFDMEIVSRDG